VYPLICRAVRRSQTMKTLGSKSVKILRLVGDDSVPLLHFDSVTDSLFTVSGSKADVPSIDTTTNPASSIPATVLRGRCVA
jgi:hypothetical protein